uniref:Uncharacterized protein n=1 Tax=Anguilla anguilla TaxID=7936 RepID=A0A0E9RZK2_ANGAN
MSYVFIYLFIEHLLILANLTLY